MAMGPRPVSHNRHTPHAGAPLDLGAAAADDFAAAIERSRFHEDYRAYLRHEFAVARALQVDVWARRCADLAPLGDGARREVLARRAELGTAADERMGHPLPLTHVPAAEAA